MDVNIQYDESGNIKPKYLQCTGKKKYNNSEQCEEHILYLDNQGYITEKSITIYFCPHCEYYHRGKSMEMDFNSRLKRK